MSLQYTASVLNVNRHECEDVQKQSFRSSVSVNTLLVVLADQTPSLQPGESPQRRLMIIMSAVQSLSGLCNTTVNTDCSVLTLRVPLPASVEVNKLLLDGRPLFLLRRIKNRKFFISLCAVFLEELPERKQD